MESVSLMQLKLMKWGTAFTEKLLITSLAKRNPTSWNLNLYYSILKSRAHHSGRAV
jgi:hypothetical protein